MTAEWSGAKDCNVFVMFFSSQVHQRGAADAVLGQPRSGPAVEANLRGKLHGVVIPFGVGNPGVGIFGIQNPEIGVARPSPSGDGTGGE